MRFVTVCVALIAFCSAGTVAHSAEVAYGFSTLAGRALTSGAVDGVGSNARFNRPFGVAVDTTGNVFVSDSTNHTVRKVTPDGTVTTLAGLAGTPGSADGTGTAARFAIVGGDPSYATGPFGIAIALTGDVLVADGDNHAIRRVTQAGVVTTMAGKAGIVGFSDGAAGSALFKVPVGLAVTRDGSSYVADTYNHVIRRISASGVVSTIAGSPGDWGTADGIGQAARFWHPTAIAADPAGNLYVADSTNIIRKLVPFAGNLDTWSVTTIAGTPFTVGSVDGTGAAARFGKQQPPPTPPSTTLVYLPSFSPPNFSPAFKDNDVYSLGELPGLAADAVGNVYVCDFSNHTIRKISPAGVVTTIGGSNNSGAADAIGATAQFRNPAGIAVDGAGNLYIADFFNHTIRKGSPAGAPVIQSQPSDQTVSVGTNVNLTVVATGSPTPTFQWTRNGIVVAGATSGTLTLTSIQANQGGTFSVTLSNALGVVSTRPFMVNVTAVPVITLQPAGQTLTVGETLRLSVTATGAPEPTYQWYRDGVPLSFGTSSTLIINNIQAGSGGDYTAVVTNSFGSVTSSIARVVVNSAHIINLSIRSALTAGEPLIVGFVVTGGAKPMLIRAIGPTLRDFGVSGAMVDPQLALYAGATIAMSNDNWGAGSSPALVAATARDVGAFALPASSLDAAIVATIDVPMTAQAFARNGAGGIVLVELYDAAPSSAARLLNVSARTRVGTGDNILIAGFVIAGPTSRAVLIRAIGPSLSVFGITAPLADPRLDVFAAGSTTARTSNDNWAGSATLITAFGQVGAFPLPSATSRDAALVTVLPPGAYSAQVSGVGNTTGEALLEIYELP
jgi:sugar lactone lactonase YvrE